MRSDLKKYDKLLSYFYEIILFIVPNFEFFSVHAKFSRDLQNGISPLHSIDMFRFEGNGKVEFLSNMQNVRSKMVESLYESDLDAKSFRDFV